MMETQREEREAEAFETLKELSGDEVESVEIKMTKCRLKIRIDLVSPDQVQDNWDPTGGRRVKRWAEIAEEILEAIPGSMVELDFKWRD